MASPSRSKSPPNRSPKCGRRRRRLPPAAARVVVKSQIHAGGRGKGTFKSGFQGGVKVAASVDEAVAFAEKMLGQTLVTKQTGPTAARCRPCCWPRAPKSKRNSISPCCSTAPIRARSSWPAPRAAWTSRKSPPRPPKKFSRNTLTPPWASCPSRPAKSPPRSASKATFSMPASSSSPASSIPGGKATPPSWN